jgi:hypothetical protein
MLMGIWYQSMNRERRGGKGQWEMSLNEAFMSYREGQGENVKNTSGRY